MNDAEFTDRTADLIRRRRAGEDVGDEYDALLNQAVVDGLFWPDNRTVMVPTVIQLPSTRDRLAAYAQFEAYQLSQGVPEHEEDIGAPAWVKGAHRYQRLTFGTGNGRLTNPPDQR